MKRKRGQVTPRSNNFSDFLPHSSNLDQDHEALLSYIALHRQLSPVEKKTLPNAQRTQTLSALAQLSAVTQSQADIRTLVWS